VGADLRFRPAVGVFIGPGEDVGGSDEATERRSDEGDNARLVMLPFVAPSLRPFVAAFPICPSKTRIVHPVCQVPATAEA